MSRGGWRGKIDSSRASWARACVEGAPRRLSVEKLKSPIRMKSWERESGRKKSGKVCDKKRARSDTWAGQ